MQLHTAGLLVIENRKLLLAFSKNKKCYYLPGGKIDTTETAASALCREVQEELNVVLTPDDLSYYTHITAPAYGEINGTIMEQECFFPNKSVLPTASAEINDLKFFSLDEYLVESKQAPGAIMILQKLKEDHLID
jgi:8-oxo-dGTP pyrophosphatase MutT (NUDIX family)